MNGNDVLARTEDLKFFGWCVTTGMPFNKFVSIPDLCSKKKNSELTERGNDGIQRGTAIRKGDFARREQVAALIAQFFEFVLLKRNERGR